MKSKIQKINKGMATIELLVAFAILLINVTSVVLLVQGGQSLSLDSETNQEALAKAEQQIEKVKSDARLDFNLVNNISSTPDNIYNKSLVVVPGPDDPLTLDFNESLVTKVVTSLVNWDIALAKDKEIKLVTKITNPDAVDGGDTCSSILTNPIGWKTPTYHTFDSVDFNPNNPNANGVEISDVDVFNGRLYVTASDTPNPTPDSFFIFDVPENATDDPIYLGSFDNNVNSQMGLNAVKVAGDYAYVANAYTGSASNCTQGSNCGQLQIIDISNPQTTGWAPSVVNVKIPATTSTGKLAPGKSIFYYHGYVYIGLAETSGSGNEFNIIDVRSGTPVVKGNYPIDHDVNSIYVKDNYAYIGSPNTENLIILNISDPDAPYKTDGYVPQNGLNNGTEVTVIGNTAYLGRTFGTDEFHILNVSNHNNISLIGKKDIGTGSQTSVHGLLVRNYLAFLITLNQFQVWDITNPSNIVPWSSDGTTNTFLSMSTLGGSGTATNCEGDRIYVAVASSQGNDKDILAVLVPGNNPPPPPPFDYNLSNSGDFFVKKKSSASNTITRTLISGNTTNVALSVTTPLPNGVTTSFSPVSCNPDCSSVFTVTTKNNTPLGSFTVTIEGTPDGTGPRSTSFIVTVIQ